MRIIILLIILIALPVEALEPNIMQVKRYQDYIQPDTRVIESKVSVSKAKELCGHRAFGCLKYYDGFTMIIYTHNNVLEHEWEHIKWGPLHRRP